MKRVLFLNLTTFSKTGGIERFNKCFLRALADLDKQNTTYSYSISAYDEKTDEKYFPADRYRGYSKNKFGFIIHSVFAATKFDIIFLGHINMAVAGVIIKRLFPAKKVILITHGIDVWRPLTGARSKILKIADNIFSVSNFTKSKLQSLHNVDDSKVTIFPNTIDPFFPIPDSVAPINTLDEKYGIREDDFVIYTLTRLSSTELYKGYDKVIEAVGQLVEKYPNIKYVIAGKYDAGEKSRIDELVKRFGVESNIIFTGFLDERELVDHYRMADMYIMPSKKEGFGIVFIEALVCGLPVVAGNADGSVDALMKGELGTLVNPESVVEIKDAILNHISNNYRYKQQERINTRQKTLENFSFDMYKQRLQNFIASC